MAQNSTTAGYFSTRTAAESAIDALKDAGFSRTQIGLVIRSGKRRGGTAHEEGRKNLEGIWEKIKDFFTGEPVEPYAGEASGRPLDDREVAPTTYSGEDIRQSLSGLSVSDERSRYFQHRFSSGNEGAIVTVTAPGREREAEQILERQGGDVGASAATYEYGQNERASETALEEEQNIRLYGEALRVHKERVNRGEVRVRKEVHTDTQSVEVPVTREELVIERKPVAGEQAADRASFEEQEIRVPLTEERASVEKQPVVREEIQVGKKTVSDVERFNEQVRKEDLKVERDIPGSRKSA